MIKKCGIGKRIGAYMLDYLIGGTIGGIVGLIAMVILQQTVFSNNGNLQGMVQLMMTGRMPKSYIWGGVISYIAMLVYFMIFEATGSNASLGKRICRCRVATRDGRKPAFIDILTRSVLKVLPLILSGIFANYPIAMIFSLIVLVDIIVTFVNKDHRSIHDMLAGTTVIVGDYVSDLNMAMPVMGNYNVVENSSTESDSNKDTENTEEVVEKTLCPNIGMKVYKLLGVSGTYSDCLFPLDECLVFGRDGGKCNVRYSQDTKGVSGMHCQVRVLGGKPILTDLCSTYGTVINGERNLQPNEFVGLAEGDTFTIGKDETFQVVVDRIPLE